MDQSISISQNNIFLNILHTIKWGDLDLFFWILDQLHPLDTQNI